MSKELNKLEQGTERTAESAEKLKLQYRDIYDTLIQIKKLKSDGKYDSALENYNALLKRNEIAAEKLNRLANERIDLTQKNLNLVKAGANMEWGSFGAIVLDKMIVGIKKGAKKLLKVTGQTEEDAEKGIEKGQQIASGVIEALASQNEKIMGEDIEVSKEEQIKKLVDAFTRGFTKKSIEKTDLAIKDLETILSDNNINIQDEAIINQQTHSSTPQQEPKPTINQDERNWVFHLDDIIKQNETELGETWKFTEEGKKLYQDYFDAKKVLYKEEGRDLLEVYREQEDYKNDVTKFYQDQERASVDRKYNEDQLTLKQHLADGLITREEYAQKEETLTLKYLEDEIALRKTYGGDTLALEEQLADMRLALREREEAEVDKASAKVEQAEASSHQKRLSQWKEYAEKASAISKQVSEVSSMVANSVGGMFNQLAQSYAQEVEELSGKIAGIDEEKEAALERVALTEEERRAKEEELANEKMNQDFATTAEQYANAEERIAILQGELSAEENINQEYAEKKAELEEEKAKKEKAQKKAEQMEKRLRMGQSIVEAIGNVAAGVAQALAHGPILGPILAAIVSAAGAVQVGIMTKQLSKMEDGGLLRGKRHTQGGMRIAGSNIEVEGGEYVVNRQSTLKNLGLLEYINNERRSLNTDDIHSVLRATRPHLPQPDQFRLLERGGQVPMMPLPTMDISNQDLLDSIRSMKFEPRVAVTDIISTHDQMVRVDEWVGMD